MSTHSAAESLDGVADVPLSREARAARGDRVAAVLEERRGVAPIGSTEDVPMQFVRFGLPAAIFLWVVIALVGYIAYRFLAG